MASPNEQVAKNFSSRLVGSGQPALPTSGTALANPLGFDCFVYIYGGTETVISLNGTQVGSAGPAMVSVGAGDSISITYSVAPTWVWQYASLVQ